MTNLTPAVFFHNLPEIEALPFDLCVGVCANDEPVNIALGPDVAPQQVASIQAAIARTSTLFGVSLHVWKQERRRRG